MSTWTPGPIVDDTVIFLRYLPLAEAGFARWISSITARKFCSSADELEAGLAERHVHVAVAVGPVLDLAALEVLDRLADIGA